jgi:undecaprenyl-diphosphatase
MQQPRARTGRRTGVVAGARTRRLPRLVGLVLAAFVLVEAVLIGLGLLVTRGLDDTALHGAEVEAARALVESRTPAWNGVTAWGSVLGATGTVIALTAVGCVLLAWRGHGPRLPTFLALAVAGETALFLLAALVVDRDRPAVPQLDAAPPTDSFPSGHTAATVALWCGLALGLARTRPGHRMTVVAWSLAGVLGAFVMASRLYRGMHWPTDVAASVVFSLLWLVLLRAILLPPGQRRAGSAEEPPRAPGPATG